MATGQRRQLARERGSLRRGRLLPASSPQRAPAPLHRSTENPHLQSLPGRMARRPGSNPAPGSSSPRTADHRRIVSPPLPRKTGAGAHPGVHGLRPLAPAGAARAALARLHRRAPRPFYRPRLAGVERTGAGGRAQRRRLRVPDGPAPRRGTPLPENPQTLHRAGRAGLRTALPCRHRSGGGRGKDGCRWKGPTPPVTCP